VSFDGAPGSLYPRHLVVPLQATTESFERVC
jgi:hypothetical protein